MSHGLAPLLLLALALVVRFDGGAAQFRSLSSRAGQQTPPNTAFLSQPTSGPLHLRQVSGGVKSGSSPNSGSNFLGAQDDGDQPAPGSSFRRPSASRSASPFSSFSGNNAAQSDVDERFTTKGLREIHLLGGPCAESGCSQIDGAQCAEGICACKNTHFAVGRTLCLPLATFYSDGCLISQQCQPVDPLAICYNSRCMCDPVFSVAGISCNASASLIKQERLGVNVYGASRGKIECQPKRRLNQTCCDTKQCSADVFESECDRESKICQCKYGKIAVGDNVCMQKAFKFGDPCAVNLQCEDLSKNSNADAVCSSAGICVARCPPPLVAIPLQSALSPSAYGSRRKRQTSDDSTTPATRSTTDSSDNADTTTDDPVVSTTTSRPVLKPVKSFSVDQSDDGSSDSSSSPASELRTQGFSAGQEQLNRLEQQEIQQAQSPFQSSQSQSQLQSQPHYQPPQQEAAGNSNYQQQQQLQQHPNDPSASALLDPNSDSYSPPAADNYVGPVACMKPARLGEVCQHTLQCQASEGLSFCQNGQCVCTSKTIPFADRCVPPRTSDLTKLRTSILGFDSGLLAPDSIFGQPRFTLRVQECCAPNNYSSAEYIGQLKALQPTTKFTVKIIGNDEFQIDPETLEIFSLRPSPIVKQEILQVQAAPVSGFSPPEIINVFIEPASCCLRRPSAEARSSSYTSAIFPGVAGGDGSNCHGLGSNKNNVRRSSSRNGAVFPGQAQNADSLFVVRPNLFSFRHCGEGIAAYDTHVGPSGICDISGNLVRFTSPNSLAAGATATCTLTAVATGCNGMQATANAEVYIVGDAGCVSNNRA